MDIELIKLFGQFGLAGVMLFVLGKIIWKIGLRMIQAIDEVGTRADTASSRIADKLDLHTKTDIAAWGEVGIKLEAHFHEAAEDLAEHRRQTAEEMSDLRQQIVEEFATLRRDLAVLGTRVDIAIDMEATGRTPKLVDEEEHSKRTHIPRMDRYDPAPKSGVPVVDRVKRPKTQEGDR